MDFLNMITTDCFNAIKQDSNMVVKGMAGSGKTTLLKAKIQYLIQDLQVDPRDLLIFVSNKNQVKDLKSTFTDLENVYEVHQYAHLLMKFYYNSKAVALKKVYRDLSSYVQRGVKERFKVEIGACEAKEILKIINKVRNETDDEMKRVRLLKKVEYRFDLMQVYDVYTKLKERRSAMDFEDMMEQVIKILTLDKQFKTAITNQFKYVLVDDIQEFSTLVLKFVKLISQDKKVMYIGSDISLKSDNIPKENIVEHLAKHLNQDVIKLTFNYRSNQTIFDCANRFNTKKSYIENVDKTTMTPKFKSFTDLFKMYEYALKKVSEDELQNAFIYRNEAMAIPLVDLLEIQQVPYTYYGSLKTFKTNKVVKELSKLITLILNPTDYEAFLAVYPVFQLDIPKRVLSEMEARMESDDQIDVYKALLESSFKQTSKSKVIALSNQMHEAIKYNSLQMIVFLLEKIGYRDYLNKKQDLRNDAYILAYEVLAQRYLDPAELLQRIENLEKTQKDSKDIVVASITQTYGEEYDRVCILDCMKTLLPVNEHSEQERNLFYYAISRAKKDIEFFTAKKQGVRRLVVSPFLFELHEMLTSKGTNEKSDAPVVKMIRITHLKKGVKIVHKEFGEGVISKFDGEMLHVKFNDGTKMMNAKICIKNKLISLV